MIRKYKIEYVGEKFGIKTGLLVQPSKPLDLKFTRRI